ncbi:MAG: radical SAM family heme chaperone HemW [Fusobacteriaceae bacterium]
MKKNCGVYIHVPFCLKKCNYCDFLSFSGTQPEERKNYSEALEKELVLYLKKESKTFNTVYFGGGTPSILDPEWISEILKHLSLEDEKEVTLEVNPGTVDKEKLKKFKEIGINRLSIGVQSFNPETLKILGRQHNRSKAIETYNCAREVGFENLSLDLMFSTPNQNIEDLDKDLDTLFELNPEHFSIYSLIWEEKTVFYEKLEKGELKITEEDLEADMFQRIINKAEEAGYIHYEISNFAKPGYESKHNKKYWHNEEYLGVGVGASGYIDGIRYKNSEDLNFYLNSLEKNILPRMEEEIQDKESIKSYKYMMGLRLLEEGVVPYTQDLKIFENLKERGYLKKNNDNYILTKKGVFFANDVIEELI